MKGHYWFLHSNSSAGKKGVKKSVFSWQKKKTESLPTLLTSHSTFHFQQTKAGFGNHTADFSTQGMLETDSMVTVF